MVGEDMLRRSRYTFRNPATDQTDGTDERPSAHYPHRDNSPTHEPGNSPIHQFTNSSVTACGYDMDDANYGDTSED
jgi:hypothetical protein